MKVLNYKKSILDDSLLVASVECDMCGHVGQVTCSNLSELHHSICSKCGYVSVERKDGQLYKDTKKLLGKVGVEHDCRVEREGLERVVRIYNKEVKAGKVDLNAFPDKEAFVRWSIEHGYRDWKALRAGSGKQLIDESAVWVVCTSNVKGSSSRTTRNERQGKDKIAKGFGVCLSSGIEDIDTALMICDEELERWQKLRDSDVIEVRERMLRVRTEYEELMELLNENF